MTKRNLMIAAASVSILMGATLLPASALDVNVGGATASVGNTANGGTKASATAGTTNASATIGGGSNVAKATVNAAGQNANVKIGTGSGPLVGARSTGTLDGGTATSASVNLGGLLGSLLGGGGPGGGGTGAGGGGGLSPGGVKAAFGGLSGTDQIMVRKTCAGVLMNPTAYDSGLIRLCQMLRKL